MEIEPESLKLTKLIEMKDIEAILTTFEKAVEVHNMEPEKWAPILALGKDRKPMLRWRTRMRRITRRSSKLSYNVITSMRRLTYRVFVCEA